MGAAPGHSSSAVEGKVNAKKTEIFVVVTAYFVFKDSFFLCVHTFIFFFKYIMEDSKSMHNFLHLRSQV